MVSYSNYYYCYYSNLSVLILIVVEDGLVLAEKLSNKMLNNEVLILIVVDDGLVLPTMVVLVFVLQS